MAACLSEAFLLAAAGAPREDREKLRILSFLVGVYVLGGVVGATAYLVMGFYFALPLAALLLALSLPSLLKRTRLSRRR